MPRLSLEEFANPPKIGDTITVTGKVEGINEESNEVEVSYDSIKVNDKKSSEMEKGESEDNPEREETVDEALSNSTLNPNN